MTRAVTPDGVVQLTWETDGAGRVVYRVFTIEPTGQLAFLGSFDRGPFDTALEVAQWAWRLIAREVPPTSP
jgi:hypothetical protein